MKPHHGLEAVIPSLNARQQPGHSPRKNQLANQQAGQPTNHNQSQPITTNHNQPTNQSTKQPDRSIDPSVTQSAPLLYLVPPGRFFGWFPTTFYRFGNRVSPICAYGREPKYTEQDNSGRDVHCTHLRDRGFVQGPSTEIYWFTIIFSLRLVVCPI